VLEAKRPVVARRRTRRRTIVQYADLTSLARWTG
jgi:hypothetical protein